MLGAGIPQAPVQDRNSKRVPRRSHSPTCASADAAADMGLGLQADPGSSRHRCQQTRTPAGAPGQTPGAKHPHEGGSDIGSLEKVHLSGQGPGCPHTQPGGGTLQSLQPNPLHCPGLFLSSPHLSDTDPRRFRQNENMPRTCSRVIQWPGAGPGRTRPPRTGVARDRDREDTATQDRSGRGGGREDTAPQHRSSQGWYQP